MHPLLKPFTHLEQDYFPEKELQVLIARQREIQPLLMDVLQAYAQTPENYDEADGNFLPLVALTLLAQFRDARVFPLLQKIANDYFRDPEDYEDLMFNIPEEDFARILASVCCGNTKALQAMVMNDALDEEMRVQALLALKSCYFEGDISRANLVEVLTALSAQLSSAGPKTGSSTLWIDWYGVCIDINPGEMLPVIRQVCEQGDVFGSASEFHIEEAEFHAMDSVQQWWREVGEEMQQHYGYIRDAVYELKVWEMNTEPTASLFDPEEENAINKAITEIIGGALDTDANSPPHQQSLPETTLPGRQETMHRYSLNSFVKHK